MIIEAFQIVEKNVEYQRHDEQLMYVLEMGKLFNQFAMNMLNN